MKKSTKFTLFIDCSTPAFGKTLREQRLEVARILEAAGKQLRLMRLHELKDRDGNTVGDWIFEEQS